jgi:hypothetical protein
MGLFTEATNTVGFLKAGFLGFPGSGKTFTMAKVAIGLHKHIKSDKPIFFYDTELGSSYVEKLFRDADIKLMRIQSRSFATLIAANREVEQEGGIFLIDSITHPWRELLKAFMKSKGITKIKFNHWGAIKEEWGVFNELFLNSKCHILMAGRAGFEYDFEENEEGEKELIKTGIKMKTEGELGFEPSLLVEMSAEKMMTKGEITGITNRAFVMKDRFDVINGKTFAQPGFESFLPHIMELNIGGDHQALSQENSVSMLATDQSVGKRLRERDILCEEIWGEMPLRFNSRTDEGKKSGAAFLREHFGTLSVKGVEPLSNEKLKVGLEALKALPILTTDAKEEKPVKPVKEEKK